MQGKATAIDGIEVTLLGQSAIELRAGDKTVYVDIFEDIISSDNPGGDLFLSTHSHWDHFDVDAINYLAEADAVAVVHAQTDTSDLQLDDIVSLSAGDATTVNGTAIEARPAHNLVRTFPSGEHFHPEGDGVGYIFEVDGTRFYHPGDTEPLDHMAAIDVDVMFVPIGGYAVMSIDDAYWALHMVEPKTAIPMHYGHIDESRSSADGFEEMVQRLNTEISTDIDPKVI